MDVGLIKRTSGLTSLFRSLSPTEGDRGHGTGTHYLKKITYCAHFVDTHLWCMGAWSLYPCLSPQRTHANTYPSPAAVWERGFGAKGSVPLSHVCALSLSHCSLHREGGRARGRLGGLPDGRVARLSRWPCIKQHHCRSQGRGSCRHWGHHWPCIRGCRHQCGWYRQRGQRPAPNIDLLLVVRVGWETIAGTSLSFGQ